MTIEEQAKVIIDSIVQDAIDEDFGEVMKSFKGLISPQLAKTLDTIYRAGVVAGASRALVIVAGAAQEAK